MRRGGGLQRPNRRTAGPSGPLRIRVARATGCGGWGLACTSCRPASARSPTTTTMASRSVCMSPRSRCSCHFLGPGGWCEQPRRVSVGLTKLWSRLRSRARGEFWGRWRRLRIGRGVWLMSFALEGFWSVGRWAGRPVAFTVAGVLVALAPAVVGSVQRVAGAHPTARGVTGASALRRLESLPVGAQSVISSTLGSSEKAFAARRSAAGWQLWAAAWRLMWARAGSICTPLGALSRWHLKGSGAVDG